MQFAPTWAQVLLQFLGTGLTLAQAKEELRKERRIALAFQRVCRFMMHAGLKISERTGFWLVVAERVVAGHIPTSAVVNTNAHN